MDNPNREPNRRPREPETPEDTDTHAAESAEREGEDAKIDQREDQRRDSHRGRDQQSTQREHRGPSAEHLRAYFAKHDARMLIRQLKRGELDDPISTQLAQGLKQVIRERDAECFTLPHTWRFATRRAAARSRLSFLKEHPPYDIIVDASCGIGLMTRELARLNPNELIGIEIDPVSAELARANLTLFGVNATIHVLDATSPEGLAHIERADLVFCDPERIPSAPMRSIDESTPSYTMLAERTKRLAYEASPRIPLAQLPDDVIELYSERRRHARTTVYRGFGMRPSRRVVSDRSEEAEGEPRLFENAPLGTGRFVELLDPTIAKAGLSHLYGSWHEANTKHLRLTDRHEHAPFVDTYRIIERGTHAAIRAAALQISDFNRIALRYPVPAGSYWREANAIRKSGSGTRTIHVFKLEDEYLLTEPMP